MSLHLLAVQVGVRHSACMCRTLSSADACLLFIVRYSWPRRSLFGTAYSIIVLLCFCFRFFYGFGSVFAAAHTATPFMTIMGLAYDREGNTLSRPTSNGYQLLCVHMYVDVDLTRSIYDGNTVRSVFARPFNAIVMIVWETCWPWRKIADERRRKNAREFNRS